MRATIPSTMQALELRDYAISPCLQLVEKPVPRPRPGQVLVRIAAAPINPSDLMFLRGEYGVKKALPIVPGFEGSGVVVKSGGGLIANALLGRRVACGAPDDGDGTWADYLVTSAMRCMPLLPSISNEQGATMLVNPLTACALVDIARRGKHRSIVQTAAASTLGRMILNLARRHGIQVIHIVWRAEQIELLRSLGAQHILDSGDPDFDEGLRDLCHRLRITIGFDAVTGEMTGRLLRAMPNGSRVIIHGALAQRDIEIDPKQLIFENKRVEGFWAAAWYSTQNLFYLLHAGWSVQRIGFDTEIRARIRLEQVAPAIDKYVTGMTEGKFLVVPDHSA